MIIKKLIIAAAAVMTLTVCTQMCAFAEAAPPDRSYSSGTVCSVTADGQEILVTKTRTEAEAAIKQAIDNLVPEGSTLDSYSIAEKIEYTELNTAFMVGHMNVTQGENAVDAVEDKIEASDPLLTITIKSSKYKEKSTPVRVKFKYKKDMLPCEFEVKSKGEKGKSSTRYELTSVNGDVTSKEKKETKTVDKGKKAIILTGKKDTPKNITLARYRKYKKKVEAAVYRVFGDMKLGKNIVAYGKKFLGNPYRYGGKSLTHGIDCVQFVRALYKRFGINLPESRAKLAHVGKRVSYKNARPGDIVYYGHHMAVYIGNGKVISAKHKGISISGIGRKRVTAIRRVR